MPRAYTSFSILLDILKQEFNVKAKPAVFVLALIQPWALGHLK